MGAGLGAQVRLGDDDDMQRLCELLVEQVCLRQTGLHVPLHGGLFEVWLWEVVIIHLTAIRAPGAPPGIGTGGGEGQRRITPELGNQVQVALPRHRQGVVVAEVPVEHHVGQPDTPGAEFQQGVAHAGDAPELWCEGPVGLGFVLAALWTSRAPPCGGRWLLLGCCLGLAGSFLRFTAHDLLDAHREGAPCVDTHEREGKEGSPGDRLPGQTGEETIQPVGVFARFGHHHFVANQQGDLIWTVAMLTKEHPKQHGPREGLGEKALDGAVTAAFARPARDPQHRDPSRQHQHGQSHPTQLA